MKNRVLIVEDDVNYRFAIRESIHWEENGFTVAGEAIHGRQALAFLKENPVEVVLTDISMPLMDGVELTRQIARLYPDILVVALSAYDDFAFVKEALKYGAKDYILKQELKPEEVIHTIQRILEEADQEKMNRAKKERLEHEIRVSLREGRPVSEAGAAWLFEMLPQPPYFAAAAYAKKECLPGILKIARQEERVLYALSDHEEKVLMFWKPSGNGRRQLTAEMRCIAGEIREWEPQADVCMSRESGLVPDAPELVRELLLLSSLRCYYPDREIYLFYDYEGILSERQADYVYVPEASADFSSGEWDRKLEVLTDCLYQKLPDERHLNESLLLFLERCARETTEAEWGQLSCYRELASQKSFAEKQALVKEKLRQLAACREDPLAEYSPEIRRAIRFMREHYREELSLGEIAGQVGLSENYFSNLFKSETGENLTWYLNRLRIGRARELLETTGLKVYEIAEAVGYHNPAYFSTIFKKVTGISVSACRRQGTVSAGEQGMTEKEVSR